MRVSNRISNSVIPTKIFGQSRDPDSYLRDLGMRGPQSLNTSHQMRQISDPEKPIKGPSNM